MNIHGKHLRKFSMASDRVIWVAWLLFVSHCLYVFPESESVYSHSEKTVRQQ